MSNNKVVNKMKDTTAMYEELWKNGEITKFDAQDIVMDLIGDYTKQYLSTKFDLFDETVIYVNDLNYLDDTNEQISNISVENEEFQKTIDLYKNK